MWRRKRCTSAPLQRAEARRGWWSASRLFIGGRSSMPKWARERFRRLSKWKTRTGSEAARGWSQPRQVDVAGCALKKLGETLTAFAIAMIARSKSEIPAWLVRCQQQGNWRLGAGRFPAELRRFEPLPHEELQSQSRLGLEPLRDAASQEMAWLVTSSAQANVIGCACAAQKGAR
jgi:hypothetical protein